MDIFDTADNLLAELKYARLDFDQPLPIGIGDVGSRSLQGGHAMRNGVRGQHIVCVQILYELTARQDRTPIPRRAGAAVGPELGPQPVGIGADQLRRSVRRAVVDDDDLGVRIALREGAFQRLSQKPLRCCSRE